MSCHASLSEFKAFELVAEELISEEVETFTLQKREKMCCWALGCLPILLPPNKFSEGS